MMCAACVDKMKNSLHDVIELPNGCFWGAPEKHCAYGRIFDSNGGEIHYGLMASEVKAICDAMRIKHRAITPTEVGE